MFSGNDLARLQTEVGCLFGLALIGAGTVIAGAVSGLYWLVHHVHIY